MRAEEMDPVLVQVGVVAAGEEVVEARVVLRLAPTPSRSPGLRDPLLTQLRSHSLCSSTRITRRGQSSEKNSKMPLSQQFAVCRESLNLAQNASGTWHDQLPFPISWAGSITKKGAYKYSIDLFQEAVRLGEQNGIPDTPRVHYRTIASRWRMQNPVRRIWYASNSSKP